MRAYLKRHLTIETPPILGDQRSTSARPPCLILRGSSSSQLFIVFLSYFHQLFFIIISYYLFISSFGVIIRYFIVSFIIYYHLYVLILFPVHALCARCCVRVIKSHRAGVGKTLKVDRLHEEMERWKNPRVGGYEGALRVNIRLHCRAVTQSAVLGALLEHTLPPHQTVARIFHIDIAHEVTRF